MPFIIFFSIIFIIYALINYYILSHTLILFPQKNIYRTLYIFLFVFFSLSYVLSRFLYKIPYLAIVTDYIGSFWIALFFYLFLLFLCYDLFRLILPHNPTEKVVIAIILFALTIVIYGAINFLNFKVKTINIAVNKKSVNNKKSYRIVVASDLHISPLINNFHINKLVNTINQLNPNIIIFGGDMLSEELDLIIKYSIGNRLSEMKSTYGTYAVLGNHEYITNLNKAMKYIEDLNIKIIRDNSIMIDSNITLIGRDDNDIQRFSGRMRKNLVELLPQQLTPVSIVVDHQPVAIDESVKNNIDIHFSGHTHDGQLWPLNYIPPLVYHNNVGYKKVNNTNVIISSGFGLWGPPVRVGTSSEIILINLTLQ